MLLCLLLSERTIFYLHQHFSDSHWQDPKTHWSTLKLYDKIKRLHFPCEQTHIPNQRHSPKRPPTYQKPLWASDAPLRNTVLHHTIFAEEDWTSLPGVSWFWIIVTETVTTSGTMEIMKWSFLTLLCPTTVVKIWFHLHLFCRCSSMRISHRHLTRQCFQYLHA